MAADRFSFGGTFIKTNDTGQIVHKGPDDTRSFGGEPPAMCPICRTRMHLSSCTERDEDGAVLYSYYCDSSRHDCRMAIVIKPIGNQLPSSPEVIEAKVVPVLLEKVLTYEPIY